MEWKVNKNIVTRKKSFQLRLIELRVRLHVTKMKSHPGMKLVPG